LERDLKDVSMARKKLEEGLKARKEDARRQHKQAKKIIHELNDATSERKRLEKKLQTQREDSRREKERARKLEKDIKNMSKDKQRLITLVQPQQQCYRQPTPGSKTLRCSYSCNKNFTAYGPGEINCPHCGYEYLNNEAHWNSVSWN
jgi:superfamily II DNA helicase RecQ